MTDQPIKIDTTEKPPTWYRKRRWVVWMVVGFAVLFALADLVSIYRPRTKPIPGTPNQESINSERPSPVQTVAETQLDESQIQWTSPTSGTPISLEYVPPGTQAILSFRPAELIAHSEGEKVLAALGPWGEWAVEQIERRSGMKLAEIESLLVALHREDDAWQCTLRMTLVTPWSQQKLKQRTAEFSNENLTLFSPKSGEGRVLVSSPRSVAGELIEQGEQQATLTRDLERLLPLTDADRTVILLMPVKFLDATGSELFLNGGEALRSGFHTIVPSNASAVAISLDWQKDFFCELKATIVQNAPPQRFAAQLEDQLKVAEQQMTTLLAAEPSSPHAKTVAERFPTMLKTLSQYTRTSDKNGIAIARCYLPLQAGHNLLLAAELIVSRSRLSGPTVPETTSTDLSTTEQLNQLTTLSLPKETLENALQILSDDVKIPIQIAGRDLQLEGITKNQTLAIDLRNRPAGEILVELLRLANPDRTATGPADPRQKLVYVIRANGVIVTTRTASTGRGEELPDVFRVPQP